MKFSFFLYFFSTFALGQDMKSSNSLTIQQTKTQNSFETPTPHSPSDPKLSNIKPLSQTSIKNSTKNTSSNQASPKAKPLVQPPIKTSTENSPSDQTSTALGTPPHIPTQTSVESKSPISFQLNNEIRLSRNLTSRNQKGLYGSIPYTEVSFYYSRLPMDFFIELELASQGQWEVYASEISLSYTFEKFPIKLQTGWLPLPLGYRVENTDIFLKELSLHQSLAKNREDAGLTVQMDLWKKHLFLQISHFGGSIKREWDNFHRTPDFAPLIVSLKTQGSFGKGFASYLKKDLALFDSLQAFGGGLILTHSLKSFNFSIQGELWWMDAKNQATLSYYLFPEVEWDKWRAGVVLGDINRFSPNLKRPEAKTSLYERIFQISWKIHPNITLMAERFLTRQRKGPFLNNLWAVRLKTQFDF